MTKKETQFITTVWDYYTLHGRKSLPWRKTHDPYKILISEVMLQQTQVQRVIPKYQAFLKAFPTVSSLADASLSDVLTLWQGLGYNRRAKMLHLCAKLVVSKYKKRFPKTIVELVELPGIGPYTAGAVAAFAFNQPSRFIETNIRSVYLHHFFTDETGVADVELFTYIDTTLDTKNPREWYYALMDYGAFLKKSIENPNRRSTHHTQQSTFKGSDRQIRGAIVRLLTYCSYTRKKIHAELSSFEDVRIDAQLEQLLSEKMIAKTATSYHLPD